MGVHRKPGREELLKPARTSFEIEHPATALTDKKVMVLVALTLVVRRHASHLDLSHVTGLDQPLESSIDGRQAETGRLGRSGIQQVLRSRGSAEMIQHSKDRGLLLGLQLHEPNPRRKHVRINSQSGIDGKSLVNQGSLSMETHRAAAETCIRRSGPPFRLLLGERCVAAPRTLHFDSGNPKTTLRWILARILIALWCTLGGEQSAAHPISVTRTLAFVSRDQATVSIEGFLEDLYLFHDLKPVHQGILKPEEIMRGVELHKRFLAERFEIRDVAGEPLKLREVSLKDISDLGNGVPLMELMAHNITFELRYELPSPPEYLTFAQKFTGETDLLPAEMVLQVKQENAGSPFSVMLMPGRPETVRFDWENPALSQEASDEEWEKWFAEQRQETLGITSYASVYSFLYIEDHEVRHEILIPLATLAESVSLERDDDEFLDLAEQDAAREAIESYFLEGNPIEIDGVEIPGKVDRLDFYGVDFKDFARQAPRKRVPMGSARAGVILSYPSPSPPQTVKLTWTRFSEFSRRVNLAVIAYDETSSTILGRAGRDNIFEWQNPGSSQPVPIAEVEANPPPEPKLSLPMLSLGSVLLGALALFRLNRNGRNAKQRFATVAGFLSAAVLGWPLARCEVPNPFRRPAEIPTEAANSVFATLLRNVYGAFRFREESALYDALALSIHGDLLTDVYLEIRRGLVMQEQGGAVVRVGELEIVNGECVPISEMAPDRRWPSGSFAYQCQWNVTGSVEHWGHIHERTNQYSALFSLVPIEGIWKITGIEIIDETRLPIETRLRTVTESED